MRFSKPFGTWVESQNAVDRAWPSQTISETKIADKNNFFFPLSLLPHINRTQSRRHPEAVSSFFFKKKKKNELKGEVIFQFPGCKATKETPLREVKSPLLVYVSRSLT